MQQNQIHTFAKWQVKEGNLDTVLSLLPEAVEKSRKESGSLKYEIFQSNTEPNTIILFESYANQEALEAHRNAPYFQEIVIGKIIPLLENRAIDITELIF